MLRETRVRARKLLDDIERLMRDVRPDVEPDHHAYPVEQDFDALLRMFFAGLLIDRPQGGEATVWALLEECVPEALLLDPKVQQEREYLSRPLAGSPSAVLTRLHLMNHVGPWFELQQAVRGRLVDDQRDLLLLVDLSLER